MLLHTNYSLLETDFMLCATQVPTHHITSHMMLDGCQITSIPQYTGYTKKNGAVSFQKLTRNLFLTLHGHNVHRQQRQLSKFLMR